MKKIVVLVLWLTSCSSVHSVTAPLDALTYHISIEEAKTFKEEYNNLNISNIIDYKDFIEIRKKTDLKDIGGFHITRHTAGSWWLQGTNLEGESVKPLRIEIVKELLGHSSVLITEKHYAKLTNQNILLSLKD